MSKTIMVLPDPHSHPDFDNSRADLAGQLMLDLAPDILVNLGDQWDFASLSGYDKGKSSFHGRNYQRDLNAGLDFSDRLFGPIRKAKRRQPYSVFLQGNHEQRMDRLLELQPELDGAISFKDLDLNRHYDEVIRYSGMTPGTVNIEGITFGHYITSGVMGRPVGGEHIAYTLLTKQFQSIVQGHTHTVDYSERTSISGNKVQALVAGWFGDYVAPWAGSELCKLWTSGIAILHDAEQGHYDLEWVSLERLKKKYGNDVRG